MIGMNVKTLIDHKYSIFKLLKNLKIRAVDEDIDSPEWKKLQVEIECYEKELATIDHDIELLEKYGDN